MTTQQPAEVPSLERKRLLNMAIEACGAVLDMFGVLDEEGWGWSYADIDQLLERDSGKYGLWLCAKTLERAEQLGGGQMTVRRKVLIPAELRWEVWERDNFTCRHCGNRRHLSIDHIIPESKGGALDLGNLQTLCKTCNSRKGDRV